MLNYATPTVPASEYARIFELERTQVYPMVDAFEARIGYVMDRDRLEAVEAAARVLSCPFKAAPPNWQHGRVIYASFRRRLEGSDRTERCNLLDIGTAKGFSALCAFWALEDSGHEGTVTSVDVLPPEARVRRNTPAEVGGLRTLREILHPWPESEQIQFEESTGIDWLKRHPDRIHVAFVDGKHDGAVVLKEGTLLADRQQPGDVVIFDDIQVPGVGHAVSMLDVYDVEYLQVLPGRKYGIGVRR